ncbi:MAG TPA: NAD(P)/FAD-dependent oxidoreductase [Acidimicrobiales bacterium]|jgi:pyruvate/2-oxoglutarate dehydrogenase complex dihydrolipoamide dehydrogenase (E3) component|nr:NAD(P)/FAD-dependent oxidoreductase [Acidimicrobiales bacterium]
MPSSSASAQGGEQVAEELAGAGLEVAGIEAGLVGGECPYWGCIPSKAMVRAGDVLAEGWRIRGRAGSAAITPDWAPVAHRVREVTGLWDDSAAVERLEGKGARFVRGRARLTGPSSVDVDGTTITARRALVLATGQRAWVPPMFASVPHWTNRELVESESVPASLLVIGGGSIGLELGQVARRFGADVTIVEAGPRLAASEEPEASGLITEVLRADGVGVHTGVAIERVEPHGPAGAQVVLADGSTLRGDRMLVATGRRSDLQGLGVAALGLDEDARSLPVDGRMRVVPGVWAVGDVTGKGAFTHVAVYQARLCVADILGRALPDADYRALPRVTFTDPEIGSVGLTEEQARREGGNVVALSDSVADSARGWLHGAEGFVKLVARDGVIVGATAMCPYGGEVFSMLALAVHAELTLESLRSMIFAYPTFHRAVDSALWSPNNAAKIAGA